MTSNRGFVPRGPAFAFGAHLLLTLLTLCLFFEIIRLLAFTSATPISHLAQGRDDSGPDVPPTYQGVIDTTIKTSGNPKRDFRDSLNSAFDDLGNTTKSIFDPDIDLDEYSKRDVVESFKGAFDDLGNTIKSIFHPADGKKTSVEAVSEYSYEELNHKIPLKDLKKAFENTYGKMKHSGNKQADDEEWIADQVQNVIPELKKKYDEANKSASASKRDDRGSGEGFKTIIRDFGIKIRANFVYEGENKSPVDWISQYADDKFNHYFSFEELKARFEKSHEAMGQKDNQTADAIWINDEIDTEFPKLKEVYKASKTDSASKHHERDDGEGLKTAVNEMGIRIGSEFVSDSQKENTVDRVSDYAYGQFDHHIPLEQLKDTFQKSYNVTMHSGKQTTDEEWANDQINNVIPELKLMYKGLGAGSASIHHERDAGDKPRPVPGTPAYYLGPSFFPYPMPPTPNIVEGLKTSLGDAFNNWRAGNITEDADKNCTSELATCNKADAITTKVDWTPKKERQKVVEACINSLTEDPSCFVKYQSTNVLKPYLTELVDKGTIKDEDSKIKKFYKRGQIKPGVYDAAKLVLSQNFLDILTTAYKKYKEDIAIHSDMSCPLTTDNVCENPGLASYSIGPDAPNHDKSQQMLETCIVFISWHPDCLQRYETKDFIKPHLQDLADSGKIEGYAPNSSASGNSTGNVLQGIAKTLFGAATVDLVPTKNESATPDTHGTSNASVQVRDGVLVDPQEENE